MDKSGIELFEVGGSIRDSLIGRRNHDKDFVAVDPEGWDHFFAWATAYMDRVFQVTPKYQTIRGLYNGEVMDVVLARKESKYSDFRHPEKCEPGTLEDDLARRDFTMNAIAAPHEDAGTPHKLIDPHKGQQAIKDRVIECVGDTVQKMSEDSLRLVRAIRFSITLGFKLDDKIKAILLYNDPVMHEALESVSRERIVEELTKMFTHNTREAMLFMQEIHPKIRSKIFGDDIWLKPTLAERKLPQ